MGRPTLTLAQRERIAQLVTEHGPGATHTADRDEDHDPYIFVAIFDDNGALVLDTIVEADGSQPDVDA
jgi:hypothetical protein